MVSRLNNLEWLRLLFAFQVVVMHAAEHLEHPVPDVFAHFPGVPAFFFVSGLLIYTSYLNAPGLTYFENRFLRLFPALLAVTLGGAAVALFAHGWQDLAAHSLNYFGWIILQVTIGQAYNPGIFRDVGVGVMNGSLWTITTEIIFYISVPLIVWFERHVKHLVLLTTVVSFIIYLRGADFLNTTVYRDKSAFDVLALTPIVWGWMFGCGILAAKNFTRLQSIAGYFPLLAISSIQYVIYLKTKGKFRSEFRQNFIDVSFERRSISTLWRHPSVFQLVPESFNFIELRAIGR